MPTMQTQAEMPTMQTQAEMLTIPITLATAPVILIPIEDLIQIVLRIILPEQAVMLIVSDAMTRHLEMQTQIQTQTDSEIRTQRTIINSRLY